MSSKEDINQAYARLSPRADILYRFSTGYADYIHQSRDYGTGQLINMTEVHTLTMIEDNPGITASDLVKIWNYTKSAISQILKKLEQMGLIYKVVDESNAKLYHLFPTDEGIKLSTAHKEFDAAEITHISDKLSCLCTKEEIDTFYKVMAAFCTLL